MGQCLDLRMRDGRNGAQEGSQGWEPSHGAPDPSLKGSGLPRTSTLVSYYFLILCPDFLIYLSGLIFGSVSCWICSVDMFFGKKEVLWYSWPLQMESKEASTRKHAKHFKGKNTEEQLHTFRADKGLSGSYFFYHTFISRPHPPQHPAHHVPTVNPEIHCKSRNPSWNHYFFNHTFLSRPPPTELGGWIRMYGW